MFASLWSPSFSGLKMFLFHQLLKVGIYWHIFFCKGGGFFLTPNLSCPTAQPSSDAVSLEPALGPSLGARPRLASQAVTCTADHWAASQGFPRPHPRPSTWLEQLPELKRVLRSHLPVDYKRRKWTARGRDRRRGPGVRHPPGPGICLPPLKLSGLAMWGCLWISWHDGLNHWPLLPGG